MDEKHRYECNNYFYNYYIHNGWLLDSDLNG